MARGAKPNKFKVGSDNLVLDRYLNEIGENELLSTEDEKELSRRMREGDKEAASMMVKSNLRFVVSIAKQYQNKGLSMNDVINEGNIGLMKAIRKFDERRGCKFISYAVWWIRQSILQALAEKGRTVRLPLNRVGMLNKYTMMRNKLEQEYKRPPSVEEVAEGMECTVEEADKILHAAKRVVFMDAPLSSSNDNSVLDLIKDPSTREITDHLDREYMPLDVKSVISKLEDKEAAIVKAYFGIGCRSKNLDEIGAEMGLTKERVRQIRERALKKLKQMNGCRELRYYLNVE